MIPSTPPGRTDQDAVRSGILPSEALTRFVPPEGFVPVATETTSRQLRYGFRVADYLLLIRAGVGSEVVPMMPVAVIPSGPAWLSGIMNLRGNLVPVCDLARLLGHQGDASPRHPMLLVLDKGDKAAAFVIDGYPRALTSLHRLNQIPTLPDLLAHYVSTAYSEGDDIWLEFDHEAFLLEAD